VSLLTACPHCHTVFRVTAELLAARDGQVRCGVCSSVFDAREHLTPEIDQPGQAAFSNDEPIEFETPEPDMPDPAAESSPTADNTPPETETSVTQVEKMSAPAEEEPVEEPAEKLITEPVVEPVMESMAKSVMEPGVESAERPRAEVAQSPQPQASLTNLAHQARRKRIRTLLLGTGSALLGLLLAAQLIYFLRTPIAARLPAVKPWLVAACNALACSVPLPHDSDAIKISSSDLLSDPAHPARIQVSLLIANEAGYAEAYPHIELTLTDTRDAPLATRIFAPNEYLHATAKEAAGIKPGSEASVDLLLDIGNLPATGYRVLVFYP